MAVSNASLSALAAARNNDTTPPYSLVPGSPSGTYSFNDYEVTSIGYSSGDTAPASEDIVVYVIALSGGSRRNELIGSSRINCTWSLSRQGGGAYSSFVSSSDNQSCSVWIDQTDIDNMRILELQAIWNDGYNSQRTYTFTIYCGGA